MLPSNYTLKNTPLGKFLDHYRVKGNETDFNHTLMVPPFGKFMIPEESKIVNKMNKLILECRDKNLCVSLNEIHVEVEPIIVDVDMKIKKGSKFKKLDDDVLIGFISAYNDTIKELFNVPENKIQSFYFQKEGCLQEKEKFIKYGFHLQYPYIKTTKNIRKLIRLKVIEKLKASKILKNVPLVNDLSDIIDKNIIGSTPWLKYGCSKGGGKPYLLKCIYGFDFEKIKYNFTDIELMNLLSIRNNGENQTKLNDDIEENLDGIFKNYQLKNKVKKKKKGIISSETRENIRLAKKLIPMLSKKRAVYYSSWINVGFALHNISDDLKSCWLEFSKTCGEKYKEKECSRVWDHMKIREDGYNIGSIFMWAKKDSPKQFSEFRRNEISSHVNNSISGTTYDVAKVLYELHRYEFVCASLKRKEWFEYRNHRWVAIEEGFTLLKEISENLVKEYLKKSSEYYNQASDADGTTQDELLKKAELSAKLIVKLKSTKFKSDIMTECRYLFYDEKFFVKLNETRNILVFKNGVYDLDTLEFREGRPNDYSSFSTGINFINYNENCPVVQKLKHMYRQSHIKTDNREFMFTQLASYLHGNKKEQKFDVWTGSGSNSKSVTTDLLKKALGDYYCTVPVTLLTRKRGNSSNASPELEKIKGKRITVFNEPEGDDVIHVSLMKSIFGNDEIQARGLFKDPIEFKPQASGLLICNKLPFIPSNDGGTWRRLRALYWGSKFVKKPNPKKKNEFQMDPSLIEQLGDMAEPFMSILLEYYKKFIHNKNGIHEPDDVLEFTKKYQKQSDIYLEFCSENLEVLEKPQKQNTNLTSIWTRFKEWHRECHPNKKMPPRSDLKGELEDRYGKPKRDGWHNIVLASKVDSDDDLDSDDDDIFTEKSTKKVNKLDL
jgi:P4 family phage/plasmid primase-like protien